jgi:hypothetical protein
MMASRERNVEVCDRIGACSQRHICQQREILAHCVEECLACLIPPLPHPIDHGLAFMGDVSIAHFLKLAIGKHV